MMFYDLDFIAFCAANGLTGDADIQGHIHANLRSKPATKAHDRRWIARLKLLNAERDASKVLYQAALAAGAYQKRTPPTLAEIAEGHPDSPQVQAARRVVARRAARQKAANEPLSAD